MRGLLQLVLVTLAGVVIVCETLAQADNSGTVIAHSVVAGESLSVIANIYGVTIDNIVAANDLDPEAFLQVGQQLRIVFPVAVFTAEPASTATPTPTPSAPDGSQAQIVPAAASNQFPAAPVAAADVARQDLSLPNAAICFALFHDDNGSGALDSGEAIAADGAVTLRLSAVSESRDVDSLDQTRCIEGLQRATYIIAANPPEGFHIAGASAWRVDLRAGGEILLEFPLAPGKAPDTPSPVATTLPSTGDDPR